MGDRAESAAYRLQQDNEKLQKRIAELEMAVEAWRSGLLGYRQLYHDSCYEIGGVRAENEALREEKQRTKELHQAILALEGSEGMTDAKFARWVIAALEQTK